uniref:Uncharacterized protein n=1 Tax=Anguilla anguilla TaxID=7936 RepID=A0A0E9TA01_ANGAN
MFCWVFFPNRREIRKIVEKRKLAYQGLEALYVSIGLMSLLCLPNFSWLGNLCDGSFNFSFPLE